MCRDGRPLVNGREIAGYCAEVLAGIIGQAVVGRDVVEGETEVSVAFVEQYGVLPYGFIGALQIAVQFVAFGNGDRCVASKEMLEVEAVLLHAGKGVHQSQIVDGHGEYRAGEPQAAEFGMEGVGGMDDAGFLGKRELTPELVKGVCVGGHRGEGFAGFFAVVEVVEPFGGGNAPAHERVVTVAGHAERYDVVVARHVVVCGVGEGGTGCQVDVNERGDGEWGFVVVEGEVLWRQVECLGQVEVGVVAAKGHGDHLTVVLQVGVQ